MPTYEYRCQKCKRRHEAFQSITAKPLTKCPKCGGRLKRLMGSGSGFLFKGSGFYITDYKKKPTSKAESAPPSPQPTESKPAASTAAK